MSEKEPFSLHSWQKDALRDIARDGRWFMSEMTGKAPRLPLIDFVPMVVRGRVDSPRDVAFLNNTSPAFDKDSPPTVHTTNDFNMRISVDGVDLGMAKVTNLPHPAMDDFAHQKASQELQANINRNLNELFESNGKFETTGTFAAKPLDETAIENMLKVMREFNEKQDSQIRQLAKIIHSTEQEIRDLMKSGLMIYEIAAVVRTAVIMIDRHNKKLREIGLPDQTKEKNGWFIGSYMEHCITIKRQLGEDALKRMML